MVWHREPKINPNGFSQPVFDKNARKVCLRGKQNKTVSSINFGELIVYQDTEYLNLSLG